MQALFCQDPLYETVKSIPERLLGFVLADFGWCVRRYEVDRSTLTRYLKPLGHEVLINVLSGVGGVAANRFFHG